MDSTTEDALARRRFLRALGTVSAFGLSGCTSGAIPGGTGDDPKPSTTTATSPGTPTETPTTEDPTTPISPTSYRVDLKTSEGEDIGEYNTPAEWDDLRFNQQALDRLRSQWNQQAAYGGFPDVIEADTDLAPNKYAHYEYPNAEAHPPNGVFDTSSFQETDSFTTVLDWIIPAVKEQTFRTYDGPPSGHANEMAASAELAIDQVHPTAETRAWGVYNGGHGTMLFYDEKTAEYWHVDTTSDKIVKPENAQEHRDDVWSPFRSPDSDMPGFSIDADWTTKPSAYDDRKRVSTGALLRMVVSGELVETANYGLFTRLFITDEWLDDAYDHIRDDGAIDPVCEPLEHLVYGQLETGEYTGIYGTLDDTRLAAGELDSLYEHVMEDTSVMTTDRVEDRLEGTSA